MAKCRFGSLACTGSGTIDRDELQIMAFELGRLLEGEELEKAFTALDADGNGSIDFEELYAWLNGEGASAGSGQIHAKLRATLMGRIAKDRMSRLQTRMQTAAAGSADFAPSRSGSVDVDVKYTWGAAHVEEPKLGVHVEIGGATDVPTLKDLPTEEEDRAAIQIALQLADEVSDEDAASLVETLNKILQVTADPIKEALEDDLPISRFELAGPIAAQAVDTPAGEGAATAAGTALTRVIVLRVFVKKDPMKPVLRPLMKAMGGALGEDVEEASVEDLIARLATVLTVDVGTSQSLGGILGVEGYAGGADGTTLHISGKVSKALVGMASSLRAMKELEVFEQDEEMEGLDQLLGLQQVLGTEHFKVAARMQPAAQLLQTSAIALRCHSDYDEWEASRRLKPMALHVDPLSFMTSYFFKAAFEIFHNMTRHGSAAFGSDEVKVVTFGLIGQPEGFVGEADVTAALEDMDEQSAIRAMAWVGRQIMEKVKSVHSIRLAGRGAGVVGTFTGLDLQPIASTLEKLIMQVKADGEVYEDSSRKLNRQISPFYIVSGDDVMGDAFQLWLGTRGLDSSDHAYSQSCRVAFTSSFLALGVQEPSHSKPGCRLLVRDGKLEAWRNVYKDSDRLGKMARSYDDCGPMVITCLVRGQDIPGALVGGAAAGGQAGKTASNIAGLLPELLEQVRGQQKDEWDDEEDEEHAKLKVLCAPWVAIVVDAAGGVPTAGAAAAARAALGIGEQEGGHPVHVSFVNLASGAGVAASLDATARDVKTFIAQEQA